MQATTGRPVRLSAWILHLNGGTQGLFRSHRRRLNGKLALLSLLDLTTAFDKVDHAILLLRLETTFGFRGTTLKWLSSYLEGEGRNQSVHLNGQSTNPRGGGAIRRYSGFCAGTSAVHTLQI